MVIRMLTFSKGTTFKILPIRPLGLRAQSSLVSDSGLVSERDVSAG